MRLMWILLPLLLAGCSGGEGITVDADLLDGQGSPLIFEVTVSGPAEPLHEFDPEQHAYLETSGGSLQPSIVNIDPGSSDTHKVFGLGFDADRGQAVTLSLLVDGKNHTFGFQA